MNLSCQRLSRPSVEAFCCMRAQAEMASGRDKPGVGVRGVKSLLGEQCE